LAAKAEEGAITALQLAVDEANAAVEEFEPGENRLMYSHIITNSNNGGSFNEEEGNYPDVDGDLLPFTFYSDPDFDLVWLRVGNIKIPAADIGNIEEYSESFNKKNLTIHAHFKKNKDSVPVVTTEEAGPEEGVVPEDENDDEDDDEKGNGKGKDKEKSNNGKKKDK